MESEVVYITLSPKREGSLQSSSSKQASSFKISIPFIHKHSAFLKTKLIYKKRNSWFYRKNLAEPLKIKQAKQKKKPQERKHLKESGLHTKFSILTSRAIQGMSQILYLGTIFSPASSNLKEREALLKNMFLWWRRWLWT